MITMNTYKEFRDYIFKKYGAKDGDTFCVDYKEYEYGKIVKSISIDNAIGLMEEFYKDVKDIVPSDDIDEHKLVKAVEKIFDKHFIVF